jgi:Zn finger protein HypA/HybF involved in hydrogenase expression
MKNKKSEMECPACHLEMNLSDNPPFILLCSHTICKTCKSANLKQTEGDDKFLEIKCPI